MNIAATLDYAVLKPTATGADIITGAKICNDYKVASYCVQPNYVARASTFCDVPICAVIGFPLGSNRTTVKVLEAKLAIEDGATELDMVMNIGAFLSGATSFVRYDVASVVKAAEGNIVKVILETCYLTPLEIARACKICEAAGASFVKTSTGFGPGVANHGDVAIMLDSCKLKIKASGGIKTWTDAVGFLSQGCSRLGVSTIRGIL
ncbi:MAG: deoxyribose-phosphate aldolase [Nitrosomonadaceae bacterium]